jgi:hypothetical protein
MNNYQIPLHRLEPILTEHIGKVYTDDCCKCSKTKLCNCQMAQYAAPQVYYIHYQDEFVNERLGDMHLLLDPKNNVIKFIGIVAPDFSR